MPAPKTYPSRRQPLLWRGTIYHGRRAVADAAQCNIKTVDYHLRVHGNLDKLGLAQYRRNPQGAAKPVSIGGRHWPSHTALAADLGVSRTIVSRWINHHPERILSALMALEAKKTASAFHRAQMIDDIRKPPHASN